jgi:RecA-family ATPase
MALHVAAGRDWHGKRVKQGAVLYIALERKKLVERRAIAFRDTYDLSNLPFAIMGGVHDFRDPRTAQRIIEIGKDVAEATETALRLICIDTLSRALCGGDENASKDNRSRDFMDQLRKEGGAVARDWLNLWPKHVGCYPEDAAYRKFQTTGPKPRLPKKKKKKK